MKLRDIFSSTPQPGWLPDKKEWYRQITWNLRNFLPGFTYGWKDEIYQVFIYPAPPWDIKLCPPLWMSYEEHRNCPTWNPNGGWLYVVLARMPGPKRRHWVSYRGHGIEFYAGTKPSDGSGRKFALRIIHAKNERGIPG